LKFGFRLFSGFFSFAFFFCDVFTLYPPHLSLPVRFSAFLFFFFLLFCFFFAFLLFFAFFLLSCLFAFLLCFFDDSVFFICFFIFFLAFFPSGFWNGGVLCRYRTIASRLGSMEGVDQTKGATSVAVQCSDGETAVVRHHAVQNASLLKILLQDTDLADACPESSVCPLPSLTKRTIGVFSRTDATPFPRRRRWTPEDHDMTTLEFLETVLAAERLGAPALQQALAELCAERCFTASPSGFHHPLHLKVSGTPRFLPTNSLLPDVHCPSADLAPCRRLLLEFSKGLQERTLANPSGVYRLRPSKALFGSGSGRLDFEVALSEQNSCNRVLGVRKTSTLPNGQAHAFATGRPRNDLEIFDLVSGRSIEALPANLARFFFAPSSFGSTASSSSVTSSGVRAAWKEPVRFQGHDYFLHAFAVLKPNVEPEPFRLGTASVAAEKLRLLHVLRTQPPPAPQLPRDIGQALVDLVFAELQPARPHSVVEAFLSSRTLPLHLELACPPQEPRFWISRPQDVPPSAVALLAVAESSPRRSDLKNTGTWPQGLVWGAFPEDFAALSQPEAGLDVLVLGTLQHLLHVHDLPQASLLFKFFPSELRRAQEYVGQKRGRQHDLGFPYSVSEAVREVRQALAMPNLPFLVALHLFRRTLAAATPRAPIPASSLVLTRGKGPGTLAFGAGQTPGTPTTLANNRTETRWLLTYRKGLLAFWRLFKAEALARSADSRLVSSDQTGETLRMLEEAKDPALAVSPPAPETLQSEEKTEPSDKTFLFGPVRWVRNLLRSQPNCTDDQYADRLLAEAQRCGEYVFQQLHLRNPDGSQRTVRLHVPTGLPVAYRFLVALVRGTAESPHFRCCKTDLAGAVGAESLLFSGFLQAELLNLVPDVARFFQETLKLNPFARAVRFAANPAFVALELLQKEEEDAEGPHDLPLASSARALRTLLVKPEQFWAGTAASVATAFAKAALVPCPVWPPVRDGQEVFLPLTDRELKAAGLRRKRSFGSLEDLSPATRTSKRQKPRET